MKIRPFLRFNSDDYPQAPSWFLTYLNMINPMIDTLNVLLFNQIDTFYNIAAERQTVTLSHGVPIQIKLRSLNQIPYLVRVGYAAGYVGVGAITGYNTDGTIMVTVWFQDATPPTSPVATLLVLEP